MLVEVIIVTVVVATIMISLYVAFNKVYTAYEEKNKQDSNAWLTATERISRSL